MMFSKKEKSGGGVSSPFIRALKIFLAGSFYATTKGTRHHYRDMKQYCDAQAEIRAIRRYIDSGQCSDEEEFNQLMHRVRELVKENNDALDRIDADGDKDVWNENDERELNKDLIKSTAFLD